MSDVHMQIAEMKIDLDSLRQIIAQIMKEKTGATAGKPLFNPLNINIVNTYIDLPRLKLEQTFGIVQECFELGNWEIEEILKPAAEMEMHRTIRDVCLLVLTQMGWSLTELREIFRLHTETISDHIKKIRRRIIAEEGLKEEYRQLIGRIKNSGYAQSS